MYKKYTLGNYQLVHIQMDYIPEMTNTHKFNIEDLSDANDKHFQLVKIISSARNRKKT